MDAEREPARETTDAQEDEAPTDGVASFADVRARLFGSRPPLAAGVAAGTLPAQPSAITPELPSTWPVPQSPTGTAAETPRPAETDMADLSDTESDLASSDLAEPDLTRPDLASADFADPDLTGRDLAASDFAEPGTSTSGGKYETAYETAQPRVVPETEAQVLWLLLSAAIVAGLAVVSTSWLLLLTNGGDEDRTHEQPLVGVGESFAGTPAFIRTDVHIQGGANLQSSLALSYDEPVTTVTLGVRDRSEVDVLDAFDPRVGSIRVLAQGQPAQSVPGELGPGDVITVALSSETSRLRVEYAARGVVERSRPSSLGRASVLLTPLVLDGNNATRSTTTVSGSRTQIRGVGCVSGAGRWSFCGTPAPTGWKIGVGPNRSATDVVAQVDLRVG